MYLLIQLLLLSTVKLLSLRYQNPNDPKFPFASCWPHDQIAFQAFFHIMVDNDHDRIPNIAGKVLNATFSQTMVRSDGDWRYYLANDESYISLTTDSYDERYITVVPPTATVTFDFTDVIDDFGSFADENGVVSTIVLTILLEKSYVRHQNGEFELSFRFPDIDYVAKLLIVPTIPNSAEAKFIRSQTYDKGCFTMRLTVPCKFLPKSTIVELLFNSSLNTASSNDIDVMQVFDEKACTVKVNNTAYANTACIKSTNKLLVYNLLTSNSYNNAYELQFCDIKTPTANVKNFEFRLYDGDLKRTSVYLNSTIPLVISQPAFLIATKSLSSQICGADFEQTLKIQLPAPMQVDASSAIRFQFTEPYVANSDLWIFSQALNLKGKIVLPKNSKGYFEFIYVGQPLQLIEIDIKIGGLRNPLNPGPANFLITFGFDNWQSVISTLTVDNSFFYDRIRGLAINISDTNFIDQQNLELNFTEPIEASKNKDFQIDFLFDNCYNWFDSSSLEVEGVEVDASKLVRETNRFSLNIKQLNALVQSGTLFKFKRLKLNKDFSRPSKIKILMYQDKFLAFSAELNIVSSPKAIKDNRVLLDQTNDSFVLRLNLVPNSSTSGHFGVLISGLKESYDNMQCHYLMSLQNSMRDCARNQSTSKEFIADFSVLEKDIEPTIVINIDKTTLNQTSTDILIFAFDIQANNSSSKNQFESPFEQSLIPLNLALLQSCKSFIVQSRACTECASGYELDSEKSGCKARVTKIGNPQRQLFSINMILDDFLKKIYSGLCLNLFAMIFILSCVLKVLFADNFDWIQFHGIICKLIWLIVSYSYLVIIAITFDADKLKDLLFILIHLSINTLVSIIFFVKLFALLGSRFLIGQSTVPKIMFSFIVVLSGISPILFTKSFKDRFIYLEYLVGPNLHNKYKTLWAYMTWYSVVFHLASLTCILALLVPIRFDQMVLFLLLTCFNVALNSCLLIINSRKVKQAADKQFTGILGISEKQAREEYSEIESLIQLECEPSGHNGNANFTVADYLPLRSVFEKMQSFKRNDSENH